MGRHFTARLHPMPVVLRSFFILLLLPALCMAATPAASRSRAPRAADRPDPVAATMAGEFALQAGKLDDATRWYLEAARASDGDAGLAERATRLALFEKRGTARRQGSW